MFEGRSRVKCNPFITTHDLFIAVCWRCQCGCGPRRLLPSIDERSKFLFSLAYQVNGRKASGVSAYSPIEDYGVASDSDIFAPMYSCNDYSGGSESVQSKRQNNTGHHSSFSMSLMKTGLVGRPVNGAGTSRRTLKFETPSFTSTHWVTMVCIPIILFEIKRIKSFHTQCKYMMDSCFLHIEVGHKLPRQDYPCLLSVLGMLVCISPATIITGCYFPRIRAIIRRRVVL